jgi:4-aminobutyrate aminotransferase
MNKSENLIKRDLEAISEVMKLRFYPFVIERAKGAYMHDPEGRKYLDFGAGWGVANLGYGHPRIIEAVTRQMEKLSFSGPISAIEEQSILLAEELISMTPGDFKKSVWYGHSGSDANEFIAKIVPIATGRPKILSFIGSYHGQTMGAYAMSGHPSQSKINAGGDVIKVPYPYCCRCAFDKDPDSCGLFCLKYIQDYVFEFVSDPAQIGAVIVEAVQCDGGDVVPPAGFLLELENLCRKHNILFIVDEVKAGLGRTGKLFAFNNFDVTPDAVVVGKPLGCGLPLSAVVGRRELMDSVTAAHLFTTAGNSVSCAAAREGLKIIKDEQLNENAILQGKYLSNAFVALKNKYDCILETRGIGLIQGIELVKDRQSKKPDATLTAKVNYRAFELGLIHFYAGVFNNVLEFTPPLIISRSQAEEAVKIIDQSIGDALSGKISDEKIAPYAGWD